MMTVFRKVEDLSVIKRSDRYRGKNHQIITKSINKISHEVKRKKDKTKSRSFYEWLGYRTDKWFIAKNDHIQHDVFHDEVAIGEYTIKIFLVTNFGKHNEGKKSNQDCCAILISKKGKVIRIGVCDGVSLAFGGEKAARIASEQIVLADELDPSIVERIAYKLQDELESVEKDIAKEYSYSPRLIERLVSTSLKTTLLSLEIDFFTNQVTVLKVGDGEIRAPKKAFPDTGGNRTLHVSPFVTEIPFNMHSQAIYTKLPLKEGFYILSSDGIMKFFPDWYKRIKANPEAFITNLDSLLANSKCINRDNVSIVAIEIQSTKSKKSSSWLSKQKILSYLFNSYFADNSIENKYDKTDVKEPVNYLFLKIKTFMRKF